MLQVGWVGHAFYWPACVSLRQAEGTGEHH